LSFHPFRHFTTSADERGPRNNLSLVQSSHYFRRYTISAIDRTSLNHNQRRAVGFYPWLICALCDDSVSSILATHKTSLFIS